MNAKAEKVDKILNNKQIKAKKFQKTRVREYLKENLKEV